MKNLLINALPYLYVEGHKEEILSKKLANQEEPRVYNARGDIIRVFYIEDSLCAHTPYTLVLGRQPKTILWDRYNIGLPIRFFTHEKIFSSRRREGSKDFALLYESEEIRQEDYIRAKKDKRILTEFNTLFTHSEELLDKYPNARFVPASGMWYGTLQNGGSLDETRYLKKEKDISMVCSSKLLCEMHKVRHEIANIVKNNRNVDGFGSFFSNYVENKSEALDKYRYSIVVENDIKPYYFTEKIIDCFASMTIPIYLGATKIGSFFNENGIIQIGAGKINQLEDIFKSCDKVYYEDHIEAVKDNFRRAAKYTCIEDYMIEEYSDLFRL